MALLCFSIFDHHQLVKEWLKTSCLICSQPSFVLQCHRLSCFFVGEFLYLSKTSWWLKQLNTMLVSNGKADCSLLPLNSGIKCQLLRSNKDDWITFDCPFQTVYNWLWDNWSISAYHSDASEHSLVSSVQQL